MSILSKFRSQNCEKLAIDKKKNGTYFTIKNRSWFDCDDIFIETM